MTILVATWSEGLFAVEGETRTQELANNLVRGLAADGQGGALAIIGQHTLGQRTADGKWTKLANSEIALSCCVAVADTIFVGTDDARLLRLSPGTKELVPVESFDHVAGRESWFAGSAIINGQRMGPPLGIRSLAANANGSVVLANVHVGGIPRSTDGGAGWQPTIDINSDVHEVCGHPTDPHLVAAASAVGLCLSRDAGATWTIERDGMHASYCSSIAFAGDDILFCASKDHFSTGRMYRRAIDEDGKIEALEEGLPMWLNGIADTGCIAAKGSAAAIVDKAGILYVSENYGRGWSQSSGELPTPSGVLIC